MNWTSASWPPAAFSGHRSPHSMVLHNGPFITLHITTLLFLLNKKTRVSSMLWPHVLHVQYKLARNTTNVFCVCLTIVVCLLLPWMTRPYVSTFSTLFTKLTPTIISYSHVRIYTKYCLQLNDLSHIELACVILSYLCNMRLQITVDKQPFTTRELSSLIRYLYFLVHQISQNEVIHRVESP